MVRAGGGYPSTAREEAVAEQKAKISENICNANMWCKINDITVEQYVEKMLEGMISKGPAKRTAKPVEKPPEKPVEDKPDKEAVTTNQQSSEAVKPEEEPPTEGTVVAVTAKLFH